MSREGLSAIPVGSPAQKVMLATLNKARYASWLVVSNQGLSHLLYLLVPFLFSVFGNDRYLPTTPGDSYGKVIIISFIWSNVERDEIISLKIWPYSTILHDIHTLC